MKISAIDIGSNTIKISVFDFDAGNIQPTESFRKTVPAGLIGHIKNGVLTQAGTMILIDALNTLSEFALSCGCPSDRIYAFATAALRSVSDFEKLRQEIYSGTGLTIDLISGEREAMLTFESLMSVTGTDRRGLLLDMGGGSTEVIAFDKRTPISSRSLPFGALILYRKFVRNILPTADELERIGEYARSEFLTAGFIRDGFPELYINGGSGRALAQLIHSPADGTDICPTLPCTLSAEDLRSVTKRIADCDETVKQTLLRILPTRIHTVAPAAAAILSLMEITGNTDIEVTEAGIRASYIKSIIGKEGKFTI